MFNPNQHERKTLNIIGFYKFADIWCPKYLDLTGLGVDGYKVLLRQRQSSNFKSDNNLRRRKV